MGDAGDAGEAVSRVELAEWAALVALGVVAASTLWGPRLLPFEDLPQHLAILTDLARYEEVRQTYSRHMFPNTNVLLHGLVLAVGGDVDRAVRVVLSAGMVAYALAAGALAKAVGGRPIGGALAMPLAFGQPLLWGFVNFWLAWPAVLVALAGAVGGKRPATVAIAALVVFLAHAQAWGVLLGGLFVVTALTGGARRVALAVVPSAMLAAAWAAAAAAGSGVGDWGDASGGEVRFGAVKEHLELLGARTFATLRGEPLEGVAVALWGAGVVVTLARRPDRPRVAMLLVALACLAGSFLLPEHAANQYYIASRMVAPAALIGAVALSPAGRAGLLVGALGLGATGALVGATRHAWAVFDREAAGALALLPLAEPPGRMLGVLLDRGSRHLLLTPFQHVASLHTVVSGGENAFSFALFESSPLRFRDPADPAHLRPGQELKPWCGLVRGRYEPYDYYLLRRGQDRCGVEAAMDAHLRQLGEDGRWVLYAAPTPLPAWEPPEECRCG